LSADSHTEMNSRQINVLLLGASGMVGQGVLRECLADAQVATLLTVSRAAATLHNPKLREIIHADLSDLTALESELVNLDACFFCLGVSAAGMSEAAYRRVTYDLTLAVASTLVKLNPGMTFVYVSGAGTDTSARGRIMWARVKGETENALLALPFKAVYMLRPGLIQPLSGIRSKTRSYRLLYKAFAPILPLLRASFPNQVLTTAQMGLAMLQLAKLGYAKRVLEARDINTIAGTGKP
jgi:uncharacterized protein YbjT (DUF2867 family)